MAAAPACDEAGPPRAACNLPQKAQAPGASSWGVPGFAIYDGSQKRDAPPIAHSSRATLKVVPGTATKHCQVTGDEDYHLGTWAPNQTYSRYHLRATDLGVSFEQGGKTWFLFGDSHPEYGDVDGNEDAIAWSADPTVDNCLGLSFVADDNRWRPPTLPKRTNAEFQVPMAGFGLQDKMYVYFTHGSTPERPMHRSILGASTNGGRDFKELYVMSEDKFINVSAAHDPNAPPQGQTYLFGTGVYRRSSPYLARVRADLVEDKKNLEYFAGISDGAERWSSRESDAATLFEHPCMGELSVTYNAHLSKWLMIYNCAVTSGMVYRNRMILRSSDKPTGPWSEAQTLFEPVADGAICAFMHRSTDEGPLCDCVSDPGRERESSDPYGGYMIPRLFTANDGSAVIYYLLSTWNPYQVFLMSSQLRFE